MSSATAYGDASESGVEAPSVAVSQLLGPESVTWNYFGDWRGMLMGLWQGSMQNLHPKLGAAVWEYSDFFGERWQRVFRSLYPIMGVVFDQTPATGAEVRDYHRTIKGTLPDGSRYHALDPTSSTGTRHLLVRQHPVCEVFGPEISESDKRILFEESRTWYAAYGVSMSLARTPTTSSSSTGTPCVPKCCATIPRYGPSSTSPNSRHHRCSHGYQHARGKRWPHPPNNSWCG